MANAFVKQVFREKRTESTIQVPNEESSINEEEVKKVLQKVATEYLSKTKNQDEELSDKSYNLATELNKGLVAQVESVKDHKIVVHVSFSQQWGQGCKVVGQCLWNSNCDRVVSVDVSNDKEICVISAFFSKIPNDSSSDEEEDEEEDVF